MTISSHILIMSFTITYRCNSSCPIGTAAGVWSWPLTSI